MKKLTLTFMALCAVCATSFAGPETYSGKEMKQVAPMPPPCPTWTGFYVGGFGGYKFGSVATDLNLTGDWVATSDDDRFAIMDNSPSNLDSSGAEAGGLIGFNWQMNKWVFGLEGTGAYLCLRNSEHSDVFVGEDGGTFDVATSFKTHYLATFGPRIGYTFCRWMPYVTGGLALGDIDYFQLIKSPTDGYRQGGTTDDTNVGWFVGGGLEYALTNHWRARVQYEYVDLGSSSFDSSGSNASGAPFSGFTGTHSVDLKEHNASFAIIYGF